MISDILSLLAKKTAVVVVTGTVLVGGAGMALALDSDR